MLAIEYLVCTLHKHHNYTKHQHQHHAYNILPRGRVWIYITGRCVMTWSTYTPTHHPHLYTPRTKIQTSNITHQHIPANINYQSSKLYESGLQWTCTEQGRREVVDEYERIAISEISRPNFGPIFMQSSFYLFMIFYYMIFIISFRI